MELDSAPAEDRCSGTSSPQLEKIPKAGNLFGAFLKDQAWTCCAKRSFKEAYLNRRLSSCDSMYSCDIRGHHGCVNALAFSKSQEQFLASGGDDQRVLVWRVADVLSKAKAPKPISMNTQHTSNIFALDFSCDNSYIYSGGEDKELLMHDFKTHHTVNTYEHMDAVYCVAAHPNSPDVVYTASEDGCVYIIDTRVARRVLGQDMLLCEAMDSFQCVAINPVEPVLIAVSNTWSGSALYDVRTKKQVVSYKSSDILPVRHDGVSVSFNSSGSQLFSMYRRRPPVLHNLFDPNPICFFSDSQGGYKNTVTMKSGCFMGQEDEYVVSGSDDFRVYIWKVPSVEELAEAKEEAAKNTAAVQKSSPFVAPYYQTSPHLVLPGHRSIVNQTRFSAVNRILVTSGVEKIVKVWSDMPINSGHTLQHSRDPPARRRFTSSEIRSILSGVSYSEPSEPAEEDAKVLALFDNLMDEDDEYPGYSDNSLSPYSDLIFPFWRRNNYLFMSSDSDSMHSDYADSLMHSDYADSFTESYSGSFEGDEDRSDDYDDWDSGEEDEEEEEEEARDIERRRKVADVLDQILRNVDENLLGLRPGDIDNSDEYTDTDDDINDEDNGNHSDNQGGGGGGAVVKVRKCWRREVGVQDRQHTRGEGVPKKKAENKSSKARGVGTSLTNGGASSSQGWGETGGSGTGMVLRSRGKKKAACNGSERNVPSCSSSEVVANDETNNGACALDRPLSRPLDSSGAGPPSASGGFSDIPMPPDDDDDESTNGSYRTRSKRKKMLDFRARCDNGSLRECYTAEDFLRTKSPTNFYTSNDKSRGKGGKRGGKKGGGENAGASGSSR